MMNRLIRILCPLLFVLTATAHDEPTSFIDLRMNATGIEIFITASTTDLAHELPQVEPDMLLRPDILSARRADITKLITSRLAIASGGTPLLLSPAEFLPIPEKRDLHLTFRHSWRGAPSELSVQGLLFPYDPRHRTFLTVHAGHAVLRQEILTAGQPSTAFPTSGQQGLTAVLGNFIYQGIHHIFMGPDHILFVIALMLNGGTPRRLLGVVTAFTLAHSITLCLATFGILTPPASLVEPVIALSIVCVGAHTFFGKKENDPRLIFAFCFGLIHGFGFANVLQEMVLPRAVLGWSLFAFNFGVEIGQGLIVVASLPVLALLRRASAKTADGVIVFGSLVITTVGAFWFFERIMA